MHCNRRTLIMVFATVLAVEITWHVLSELDEPRYEGKRITRWLSELRIGFKVMEYPDGTFTVMLPNLSEQELARLNISTNVRSVGYNTAMTRFFTNWPDRVDFSRIEFLEQDRAGKAIKRMGVTGLPYLVANLHRRESATTALFCRWVWPRVPERLQRWIGNPIHPVHMRANAAYALGILGSVASPALPDLQESLRNDKDYLVRSVAREALQRVSPEAAGRFYPELFEQRPTTPAGVNVITNSSAVFSSKLSL